MKTKLGILAFFIFNFLTISLANAQDEFDEFYEFDNEFALEEQEEKIYDPFEKYNRVMTKFNLFLYDYIEYPVLYVYDKATPNVLKKGVNNFFYNLATPIRIVGNLFALEPKRALNEFRYFMINSTWGLGGFVDIAKKHRQQNDMDVGLGLAHLGVKPGPHIVLPVFGPSNLRDTLTMPLSILSNPITYINPYIASAGTNAFKYANKYSINIQEVNMLYKGSLDPYIILRNFYEKNRKELSK